MKIHILIAPPITSLAFSQTHKPYNGDFEKGKGQYQYYFDADHETVIDRVFSYAGNDTISFIRGAFRNNKKEGAMDLHK